MSVDDLLARWNRVDARRMGHTPLLRPVLGYTRRAGGRWWLCASWHRRNPWRHRTVRLLPAFWQNGAHDHEPFCPDQREAS